MGQHQREIFSSGQPGHRPAASRQLQNWPGVFTTQVGSRQNPRMPVRKRQGSRLLAGSNVAFRHDWKYQSDGSLLAQQSEVNAAAQILCRKPRVNIRPGFIQNHAYVRVGLREQRSAPTQAVAIFLDSTTTSSRPGILPDEG